MKINDIHFSALFFLPHHSQSRVPICVPGHAIAWLILTASVVQQPLQAMLQSVEQQMQQQTQPVYQPMQQQAQQKQ